MAAVEWGEPSDIGLYELLRGHDGRRNAPVRDERAKEIVTLLGEHDPWPAKDMKRVLQAAGFSTDTIKHVKKVAGVRSMRVRDPETKATRDWLWTLGEADDE